MMPEDRSFTLEREQWLPRPVDEVFAFFTDAYNLELITPPWLYFDILRVGDTPLKAGTLIDYRLRLYGVPVYWRTKITEMEPPARFVDIQVRGPYKQWVHTHTFSERNGGTLVQDHVAYAVPGGRLVQWLLVKPDLERIFDYRRRAIDILFPSA